ncbi:MAG: MBL fold metallo-hydrolase [Leptothrix sp. (in: Bacteria)]|nr:MBL fold metallo-hydrolase [Leptothrix sp. (in: b-proteobacteria)]
MPDEHLQALADGVYAIDTGFQRERFDAAFLLVQEGRAAFIDTGTQHAVPRLLAALRALDLDVGAVDWIIPTHVHLDHAGGVGGLLSHLPHARVMVHPRGARHLLDPARLWASASAVYGDAEMLQSYSHVVPVPAARLDTSHDGLTIELAGRPLRLADTRGHARHHHCVWDERTRGWFTGDTFGLSYREFDTAAGAWIMPTTTPVQFEPEHLQATVLRLLATEPDCMYLTHFGRVGDVPRLGARLLALLSQMVDLARSLRHAPGRHRALIDGQFEIFSRSLSDHGCALPPAEIRRLLAMDLELNAQGMATWLDRHAR